MHLAMRQYGTLGEIHERAQVIALMRIYGKRWRPLVPEDGIRRGRPKARRDAPTDPDASPWARSAGHAKKSALDCGRRQKADRDKNRYREPGRVPGPIRVSERHYREGTSCMSE
jgi:hypothetical protein